MSTDPTTEPTRVITREQLGVKVLTDAKIIDMLFDIVYEPIIIVLREGPMTIKTLVDKYNDIAAEPKSEMTIYRYVKELGKHDIVAEVGKIVTTGQSASETLYGRTAKIFWNLTDKEHYWSGDDSKRTLSAIRDLLALYKKDTKITAENLGNLLTKTANKSNQELAAFFETNNAGINEIISGYSFKEVDKIFDYLGNLILLMHIGDFEEELEQCGC